MARCLVLLCLMLVKSNSYAFEFGNTSFSYLYGSEYAAPDFANGELATKTNEGEILTFEHVNGWTYGDNYIFFDIFNPGQDDPATYLEINPRISGHKIFGFELGPIADVLLTGQYNLAAGSAPVRLYGFALDFAVPGLQFLQSHFYYRDDRAIEGSTYQITLVWLGSFKAGLEWEYGGFLDYAAKEGETGKNYSVANTLTQPYIGVKFANAMLGIEYQYWQNKYGIDGLDESLPQAMVKYSF